MTPDYELVRTARKTLALYVRRDGRLEVRAPLRTSRDKLMNLYGINGIGSKKPAAGCPPEEESSG